MGGILVGMGDEGSKPFGMRDFGWGSGKDFVERLGGGERYLSEKLDDQGRLKLRVDKSEGMLKSLGLRDKTLPLPEGVGLSVGDEWEFRANVGSEGVLVLPKSGRIGEDGVLSLVGAMSGRDIDEFREDELAEVVSMLIRPRDDVDRAAALERYLADSLVHMRAFAELYRWAEEEARSRPFADMVKRAYNSEVWREMALLAGESFGVKSVLAELEDRAMPRLKPRRAVGKNGLLSVDKHWSRVRGDKKRNRYDRAELEMMCEDILMGPLNEVEELGE